MDARDRQQLGTPSPARVRTEVTPRQPTETRTVIVNGAAVRVLGKLRLARGSSPPPVARTVTPTAPAQARYGVTSPHAAASAPVTRTSEVGTPRSAADRPSTEGVRPDDLSPAVRRLMWHQLDSAVKIEVLRHARAAALPWTIDDLAARLGVSDTEVAVAAVGLCQGGLLQAHGARYQRTPRADLLGAAVDVIERAYGTDPVQVLRAIDRLARGRAA